MKMSQAFIYTFKDIPSEIKGTSVSLLWRAGFIDRLGSGIYSFLPLGWRVHQKISQIIREEMNKIAALEICLPALQPKELWRETSRWDKIDPPLFQLKDRHGKELALGSTHEEVITDIVRKRVKSFKDLPLILYQIQAKFRNEQRATSGLLRTREFIMKDAYSFHPDEENLEDTYKKIISAYKKIFQRCGLPTLQVKADTGTIGGVSSHEFMIVSQAGEDKILLCPKCGFAANVEVYQDDNCPSCKSRLEQKDTIEIAHIFNLGTEYSEKMGAYYLDNKDKRQPIVMGCYGIGVGRLLASIVEVSHDKNGIIWPKNIAPFQIHLVLLNNEKKIIEQANKIYQNFTKENIDVLLDDRPISAGQKLVESDLIGIPLRVIISSKTVEKNQVEIKARAGEKTSYLDMAGMVDKIKKML